MPRTPVEVNTEKSNPFITKSISKTLLTPCRQVGLSRKRKTPSNSNASESSTVTSSSTSSLETTPVTSNPLLIDGGVKSENNDTKRPVESKEKKKGKVSKRLMVDDESAEETNLNKKKCVANSNNEDVEPLSVKEAGSFSNEEELFDVDSKKDKVRVTKQLVEDQEIMEDKKQLPNKDIRQSTVNRTEEICNGQELFDNHSTKETVTSKNKKSPGKRGRPKGKSKTPKQVSRNSDIDVNNGDIMKSDNTSNNFKLNQEISTAEIHTKSHETDAFQIATDCKIESQVSNNINTDKDTRENQSKSVKNYDEMNDFKKNLFQPDKNPQTSVPTIENKTDLKSVPLKDVSNGTSPDKKGKKIKRSLSMKKSSKDEEPSHWEDKIVLDDCVISLTPIENKLTDLEESRTVFEIPESEVKNLAKQIKVKKELLNELIQADIYKQKHKLKDLHELTNRWKTGCISALQDLLPQLQRHGSIDMASLLIKLNVPEEKIRLTQDGDLV